MKNPVRLFFSALAFLTRVPVPMGWQTGPDALASSAAFFPVVGLLVSAGAALLNRAFSRLVPHNVVIVVVLLFLILVTGALHEDALADAADGFGGGWEKEQILTIMRDSRLGSFGALAITFALLARFVFLISIPAEKLDRYLVAALVTCRWTSLPLAFFLPAARQQSGLGSGIAGKISAAALTVGTVVTAAIVVVVLRAKALWILPAAVAVTVASGIYYHRRIGGITGDCLGATNQLTEVAIYFAGVVLG